MLIVVITMHENASAHYLSFKLLKNMLMKHQKKLLGGHFYVSQTFLLCQLYEYASRMPLLKGYLMSLTFLLCY